MDCSRMAPRCCFSVYAFLSILVLVTFVYRPAKAMSFRTKYCQHYAYGGKIEKSVILTPSVCQKNCEKNPETCHRFLYIRIFACCLFYKSDQSFDEACTKMRKTEHLASTAGCPEEGPAQPRGFPKLDPHTFTTTTVSTTTSSGPPTSPMSSTAAGDDATTVSDMEDETEAPEEDDEDCEERIVPGTTEEYVKLQNDLRAEQPKYTCSKLCIGPTPPRYPSFSQSDNSNKKKCKPIDPSTCAMIISNLHRPIPPMMVTVTLCKIPPTSNETTTTEPDVTGATTEAVTEVTGSTEAVTGETTAGDVTATTVSGVSDGVTSADVSGATSAAGDVSEAPEATDESATDESVTSTTDDVTSADVTSADDVTTEMATTESPTTGPPA